MLTEKLLATFHHKRALGWAIDKAFRQIERVTQITRATRFVGERVGSPLVLFAHTRIGALTMPDMGTSQYTRTCLWPLFRIRGSGGAIRLR